MKKFIVYPLLGILLSIVVFPSFAQQNQNTSQQEIEALKKQISEIQTQLKTVENIEKMELAAKLAEAQAKLRNAEVDKFKRELKDANDKWLRTWSLWFVGIIGFLVLIVGGAFWFWLRSRADQLIVNSVEKSLNGFKEAVKQVDILKNQVKEAQDQLDPLKNQIRVLEKENAISVLRLHGSYHSWPIHPHPEKINALPEQILLDVFGDETCDLYIRRRAAQVLTLRKSTTRLLSPLLELLNLLLDSVVDNEIDEEPDWATKRGMDDLLKCLEYIPVQETYEGLTKFLDRLLSIENSKDRNWLVTYTVCSLGRVIRELNKSEPIPALRRAIPYLQSTSTWEVKNLAQYFDKIKEPEVIKEILIHANVTGMKDDVRDSENYLLEFLEKYDPEFVVKWKAEKETTNTESEESDESKPTK